MSVYEGKITWAKKGLRVGEHFIHYMAISSIDRNGIKRHELPAYDFVPTEPVKIFYGRFDTETGRLEVRSAED